MTIYGKAKKGTKLFRELLQQLRRGYVDAHYPNQRSYAYQADLIPISDGEVIMKEILKNIVEIDDPAPHGGPFTHPSFRLKGEDEWRSVMDSNDFPQPTEESPSSEEHEDMKEHVDDAIKDLLRGTEWQLKPDDELPSDWKDTVLWELDAYAEHGYPYFNMKGDRALAILRNDLEFVETENEAALNLGRLRKAAADNRERIVNVNLRERPDGSFDLTLIQHDGNVTHLVLSPERQPRTEWELSDLIGIDRYDADEYLRALRETEMV